MLINPYFYNQLWAEGPVSLLLSSLERSSFPVYPAILPHIRAKFSHTRTQITKMKGISPEIPGIIGKSPDFPVFYIHFCKYSRISKHLRPIFEH